MYVEIRHTDINDFTVRFRYLTTNIQKIKLELNLLTLNSITTHGFRLPILQSTHILEFFYLHLSYP